MILKTLVLVFGGLFTVFAGGCSVLFLSDMRLDARWELLFNAVLLIGVLPTIAAATLTWLAFWKTGVSATTGLNRYYQSPIVTIFRCVTALIAIAIAAAIPARMILSLVNRGHLHGDLTVLALCAIIPALIGGLLLLLASRIGA